MEHPEFKRKLKESLCAIFDPVLTSLVVLWVFFCMCALCFFVIWILSNLGAECPYECIGYCKENLDNNAFFEIKCDLDQSVGEYNYTIENSDVDSGKNYTLYARCTLNKKTDTLLFVAEFSLDLYYYDDTHVNMMVFFIAFAQPFVLAILILPLLFLIFGIRVYYRIPEFSEANLESAVNHSNQVHDESIENEKV